jgi:capsid protein
MKETPRKRRIEARQNLVDKAISIFSPVAAARRLRARLAMEIFSSYDGASKTRRSLKEWNPYGHDADGDILPDLETLRERSRDLVRNNPIASGAIKTKVTNVIGTGFVFKSVIDREAIGLSDEQAEALEATIEREWRLF